VRTNILLSEALAVSDQKCTIWYRWWSQTCISRKSRLHPRV